jgi:dTDP-4-amino-4,6-dideoxygalactose transaminase
MIPLFYPQIYKHEWIEALSEVFSTRWIGQGPLVDVFEGAFGDKYGYKNCLALNSGSAALELAYDLVGIRKGDEVITPCFTCTATNIPLVRRKAKIVFADINDLLTIDYKDVCSKINVKTKAIVVVTLGGLPVDERIFTVARSMGIPVIVDAAQSLGVSEQHGDYICYSFQAIKHFTTGDGGILVVKDRKQYERAKKLRWFGIDREAKRQVDWKCLVNHQMAMEIEEAGYKFHMNDVAAAMGLVGLQHSDEILYHRQALCGRYMKKLPSNVRSICGGSCWLFAIILDDRNRVMDHLQRNGIECDLVQLRNDIFKVFGGRRQNLPMMNSLEDKYLYLPLNGKVTVGDVDFITGVINECNQLSVPPFLQVSNRV